MISIVLLNWNGIKWLDKFLPSLIKYTPKEHAIYIIDNNSSDNSVNWLTTNYPEITTIVLPKNYGFAKGYNEGLKQIQAEYYLLLNSDVEVTQNWIEPIYKRLKSSDSIKVVQPKIKSFNNKKKFEYAGAAGGFIDILCYPFCRGRILNDTEYDKEQYNKTSEIFWASGACFGIESKLFHKLGGFDEIFFAHMEEIDLCWRIKNLGYRVIYEPNSTVYHVGGGTLSNDNPFKLFLNIRNSLMMILKNCPFPACCFILFMRLILDGLFGLKFLLSGKFKHCFIILKSHFSFYSKIPVTLKHRKFQSKVKLHPEIIRTSIIVQHFILRKSFSDIKKVKEYTS